MALASRYKLSNKSLFCNIFLKRSCRHLQIAAPPSHKPSAYADAPLWRIIESIARLIRQAFDACF
jgi:hypothetical protein